MSIALHLYRSLSWGLSPLVRLYFSKRLKIGKEDPTRYHERWGAPSQKREENRPLIWIHAVSVGEAVSTLPLLKILHEECRDAQLLLTTGTVASAKVIAKRLPPYVTHQFAPLDLPQVINRFLEAWDPDLALGVESELWPNMLSLTQERGIPTILLNGKLSQRSFQRWKWMSSLISPIFTKMALVGAQTPADAKRFSQLKAPHVEVMPNLKLLGEPISVNTAALRKLKAEIKDRPHWCAANTHPGEDELIIEAHIELKKHCPELLTIIVPRHPERADDIRKLIESKGLSVAQRSSNQHISESTDIYLADTLGEMGLYYALCGVIFLGATFVAKGGHNPIEPAQLGAYVLHGTYTSSNPQLYSYLKSQGIAEEVQNKNELVSALLSRGLERSPESLETLKNDQEEGLKTLKKMLKPYLISVRGNYAESA